MSLNLNNYFHTFIYKSYSSSKQEYTCIRIPTVNANLMLANCQYRDRDKIDTE